MLSDEQIETRKRYQRVVGIVHNNTTPKQPPMIHKKHVRLIASYSDIPGKQVDKKLMVAKNNGDIVGHKDRYVSVDADRLDRAIDAVVEQVPVDQTLLGKLNTARMQLD